MLPLIAAKGPKFVRKHRVRKFAVGEPVGSMVELVERLERGEWHMLRGVPKHPSILQSMTLRTLMGFVCCRMLKKAEPAVLSDSGVSEMQQNAFPRF